MWFLSVLWFLIKWGLIIGVPAIIILEIIGLSILWNDHNKKDSDVEKTATITFENFIKLYPVNASRWRWCPNDAKTFHLDNDKIIDVGEGRQFRLFFRDDTEIPRWSSTSYAHTQIFFKNIADFWRYCKWIDKRNKAIKNKTNFEIQKREIDNMDNILKTIQGDIDKMREDANQAIEDSAKKTIDIVKQIENDPICELFYKDDKGHWMKGE